MKLIKFDIATRDVSTIPSQALQSCTYVFRGQTFEPEFMWDCNVLNIYLPDCVAGRVSVELIFQTAIGSYRVLRGFDTSFDAMFDAGSITINDEEPNALVGGLPGNDPSFIFKCGNPASVNPDVAVKDTL